MRQYILDRLSGGKVGPGAFQLQPKTGAHAPKSVEKGAMGTGTEQTPDTTANGQPPAPPAPKADPPAPKGPPQITATPPAPPPAPPAPEGPKRARLGAEDDIPEDAELLELPKRALESRLNRHTKSQLQQRFGTSDMNEIKTKLDRLAELETAEEQRKREQMSEQERLQADLQREKDLRIDAERRLQSEQNNRVVGEEEARITAIGVKHLRTKYVRHALPDLAAYLRRNFSDEELAKLKDKDLDDWFGQYAKDNPELARTASNEPPPKKPPQRVPLTNGTTKQRPDAKPPSGSSTERNFSPSAPNAMSREEARAEARKQGFNW